MSEKQISFTQIERIYNNYNEQGTGPTNIRLTFNSDNETATIHIRCSDDCEPYYSWAGEYPCTLKNLTSMLIWKNNFGFINDYGEPYSLFIEVKNTELLED